MSGPGDEPARGARRPPGSGQPGAADRSGPSHGGPGNRLASHGAGEAGTPGAEDVDQEDLELIDDGIAVGLPPQEPPTAAAGARGGPEEESLILADVAALAKERDDYLRALQQLQADFENYRKRVLRQQDEQGVRAAADLVGKLLPVLDTLDLAEAHLSPSAGAEASHEAKALSQARGQLLDVLRREGLERVDEAEVAFDPSVHDAVAHAPAEPAEPAPPAAAAGRGGADLAGDGSGGAGGEPGGPEGSAHAGQTVVDEVLRSGYTWRGKVVRPAMVRVRG